MWIQPPAPPTQTLQAVPELPLLPGSDPTLLGTYRWTLAHSPALQQLVRKLLIAEPKARYRLVPGVDLNYGSLLVAATREGYEIDLQVSTLAWVRCGDALEPWVASALFLALETASKGELKGTGDPNHLRFTRATMQAAFVFQDLVRKELVASDPERLKDLPHGRSLYEHAFPRSGNLMEESTPGPRRRALPDGLR